MNQGMNLGICCIAKNEDKYIEEFIAYHLKLGFDHIYVFQNNWRHKPGVFDEYYNVSWYVQDGEQQQLNAYNRFMTDPCLGAAYLDWVAFIDVDEFLCVRTGEPVREVLRRYANAPALSVNWRLFGSSGLKYDGKENSVLKRFTKCQATLNRHVKQLVNLKFMRDNGMYGKALMTNPHHGNFASVNQECRLVRGPFNQDNLQAEHPLEINHFAVKTWDECLEKCARGRADYSVKRNAEEFFKEHDLNEVENTVARDFFFGAI